MTELSELECWVHFDGPEPDLLRPMLDAVRDLPPATAEDAERAVRRFLAERRAGLSSEHAGAPPAIAEVLPVRPGGARLGEVIPPEPERAVEVLGPSGGAESALEAPPEVEPLAETRLALDLPREMWEARGKLPFRAPLPNAPKSARTLQVPVMRSNLGETMPLDDDRMAAIVAALPFGESTFGTGTGTIPFPRLTLEQYASLHAELAVGRVSREATFERYRVLHEPAFQALSGHWERRFAAQPDERARFDRTLATFTAWLRAQPV